MQGDCDRCWSIQARLIDRATEQNAY